MSNYSIRVENLSKRYKIGGRKSYRMLRDSIQEAAHSALSAVRSVAGGSRRASRPAPDNILWALKDVSFEVEVGSSTGIIGSNGAGKSTLLKILSRVTVPTSGRVRLRGRVGSLLEVGTGFHPELTGRENVFLNGAILGMSRREIESKFDEIVEFSEIQKFLDTPVKFYSSGMRMRLAFSVAAHLEPEILLIDEVLAVGDQAFQKKSLNKMDEVVKQGRTVLFVSHNMASIKALCTQAIYLENGQVRYMGEIDEVIEAYLGGREMQPAPRLCFEPQASLEMQVLSVAILDQAHRPTNRLPHDRPFDIELKVAVRKPLFRSLIGVSIEDSDLDALIHTVDYMQDEASLLNRAPGVYTYRVHFPALLTPGNYRLSLVARSFGKRIYHRVEHVCPFEVFDNGSVIARAGGKWGGKVTVPVTWECRQVSPPDFR